MFHELAAGGTTLLVSSHVMDEAERCDDLVLLRNGRIVATGAPSELLEETHTEDLEEAFLTLAEAHDPGSHSQPPAASSGSSAMTTGRSRWSSSSRRSS